MMSKKETRSTPPVRVSDVVATRSSRRTGTESVRVYDALRDQILSGALPPGVHLKQQAIAKAMGISNGPVISALRRLAHDGLVMHERSHGCRVCEWSEEKLDGLLTVRRALETEAMRLAARRAGSEDLELLHGMVDHMADLVRRGRRPEAYALDVEFHVAIARLTRSPSLVEALARCHLLEVVRRRQLANERFGDFENLAANHRVLVEAIASGDPEIAAKAIHFHLRSKRSAGRAGHGTEPSANGHAG